MDTNDLNRRIRYALSLDDADVLSLLKLVDYSAQSSDVEGWRIKEGEPDYLECPAAAVTALLDGLIVQKRGPRTSPGEAPLEPSFKQHLKQIDNNHVLKQIRIALSLRADDVAALLSAGGGRLSKSEINALFRKPDARNYRKCGDQVLRWFLSGLAAQRDQNTSPASSDT